MTQLYRRFADDQIKALLNGYCHGLPRRFEVQDGLGVGNTRFCALVTEGPADLQGVSVARQ